MGNDPSSADNRVVLPSMLYGIEDVGEVPGCVGGTNFWHGIRLSDMMPILTTTHPIIPFIGSGRVYSFGAVPTDSLPRVRATDQIHGHFNRL